MLRLTRTSRFTAPSGRDILFGILDPADIEKVKTDPYQRNKLPLKSIKEWKKAFYAGEVPPLDFGSRSRQAYTTGTGVTIGGEEIYVVDGLQRLTTARVLRDEGEAVFIPVMVYLGTTREWEIARFSRLNADRVRVNPNHLLHNAAEQNPAIAQLWAYAGDDLGTLLGGKVQWTQSPRKGNLITAVMLLKTMAALHGHWGKNMHDTDTEKVAGALADAVNTIGEDAFCHNMEVYFSILEAACKLSTRPKSRGVVQLSLSYMVSLATMLSSYQNFWDKDYHLTVRPTVHKALAEFYIDPVRSREISNLGRKDITLIKELAQKAKTTLRKELTPWDA